MIEPKKNEQVDLLNKVKASEDAISLGKNWAKELSQGLVSAHQLASYGLTEDLDDVQLAAIKNNFDIRVPKIFLEDIANNNCGLKKQFIPSKNELVFFPEELEDPIGDEKWSPVEGLTHRYPDRVLLKPTYMCAGYCRFCFRRYKVSHTKYNLKEESYQQALDYIQNKSQISEIILTGGDPLTLTNKSLNKILQDLAKINHLQVIRFHTRIPSLLPSRIDMELIEFLKNTKKAVWIVAHINHVDEFKEETRKAISLLIDNGFPLVMQSVLLKGVNSTQNDLIDLFKMAVKNRVKPYYLHYPDLAKGTKHFRIPLSDAIALVKSLRGKISGLCIPQFIIDIPGGKGKIEVDLQFAKQISDHVWQFESPLDGKIIEVDYK